MSLICLRCLDIFDYTTYYTHYLEPKLYHYQEPHQFRMKLLMNSSGRDAVFLHYKSWVLSKYWHPCQPSTINVACVPQVNQHYVQIQAIVFQVASMPCPKSTSNSNTSMWKTTLGQKTASWHVTFKRASTNCRYAHDINPDNDREDTMVA